MVNQSVQSSFLAPFFMAMTMASEIAPSPKRNCQHRSQDDEDAEWAVGAARGAWQRQINDVNGAGCRAMGMK